ncbi:hypothetical protein A0H76_334 [Hepatospora eriocheir]|uniref:Uncharacterized protein n=1 Tax=Hepatospora eriocheir TaxID=1081669 RepID=A0A1X0QIV8_9MICR|nr:hypothetical protein A0H76_334 [Hepatospora eriocheir]
MNLYLIQFIKAHLTIEELYEINERTYNELDQVTKSDFISKVKINFYEKCPLSIKKCSADSCSVPIIKYKNKDGIIDLLKVRESYSPTITNGSDVWRAMYNLTPNKAFHKILNGMKFSVTTHISAFYTNFIGNYFPNPFVFRKSYTEEYQNDFINLYMIIRNAIGSLKHTNSVLHPEVKKIVDLIEIDKRFDILTYDSYELIEKCIECVACLDCQKCILWGTIQLRGLRTAIEVFNKENIDGVFQIYLINLFRRLSETVKQSHRLKNIRYPFIYLVISYYKSITTLTLITIMFGLLIRKIKSSGMRTQVELDQKNK